MLPPGRKCLTLRIKPSVPRIGHRDNQNDRRNLHRNLVARVFLRITASGLSGSRVFGGWLCAGADRKPQISSTATQGRYMIGRRAGGNNCAGDADISCGVTMRAGASGGGPCPPPAVAAETLSAGGDRQHELRPSPAGRSAIPTARTPSDRCRRPPHRPNHHRASPAAGCAAIPSVAPQRSPRGRRDRTTARTWTMGGW